MWTSFIGFMGCGKSTVTRCLQTATRRPAVSVDALVAQEAGIGIADIFAREGEGGFRKREMASLASLPADSELVVDTGGGVVETPAAVELLKSRGVVLWLDAPWYTVRTRLKSDGAVSRPLVERLGWAGVEDLYRRRRGLYAAAADFRLRADGDAEDLARTAMLRNLLWSRRDASERR